MRPAVWLLAGVVSALALIARRVDAVEVRGRSMAPTLLPGDRLLAIRLARSPRVGEVVLAPDPRATSRELVKRVAGIDGNAITLRGDNPAASTDARSFGQLPVSAVRWRVVLRYWPRDRIGRLPASPPRLAFVDEGGEPACPFPEALVAGE